MLGLPDGVSACLFDLDGVLTDTAKVHGKAWKQMFDDFLRQRAERTGDEFAPFDAGVDRVGHADGLRANGASVVVTDLAQLLENDKG